MGRLIDITGIRFGRRVVCWPVGRSSDRVVSWLVLCDCGTLSVVAGNTLKRGTAYACHSCAFTKHGHRKGAVSTPEYATWRNMIQRCTNPSCNDYINYGARGIKICRRWRKFENFLIDMGPKPLGLTLERIDNNKGYSKNNCRWATRLEQRHNQRRMMWHNTSPMMN